MAAKKSASMAVLRPNFGLFYDQPPETVPPQALVDGNNFRIKQGVIDTRLLGRSKFLTDPLPGPVMLVDNFLLSTGSAVLIFGTLTDLLQYNSGTPVYITPSYVTGTVAVTNGSAAVVGTGTAWNTSIGNSSPRKNIQAGDFIFVGSAAQNAISPAGGWYEVLSVTDDTHLTLKTNYTGSTASGQAYTGRQCFTGTFDTPWATEYFTNADDSSGTPIGDQWIAANGLDAIVSWNGTDTFARFQTVLGFTCKWFWRYKDQLLYQNVTFFDGTDSPTEMVNSDAGKPFDIVGGIANSSIVTDGNYPIVCSARLFDQLVIYTKSTVTGSGIGGEVIMATFLGGELGYAFRTVVDGRSPLAPYLVADFGYYHKFLGFEGEWLFNGISLQFVGSQIWRQISPSIDLNRINRSFCYFDEYYGELIWALTYTTDVDQLGPEVAFVEHYLEDNVPQGVTPYSKRDFKVTNASSFLRSQTAATWASLTGTWNTYSVRFNSNLFSAAAPLSIVGDADGNVLQMSTQDQDFDGSAIASFVTFPPRILVDERHNGLIRRVYIYAAQASGYTLTVTTTTYARLGDANPTHTINAYALDQSGQRFVNPFAYGRVGQIQVGTPGPNQPFVLDGYDMDVVPGGEV